MSDLSDPADELAPWRTRRQAIADARFTEIQFHKDRKGLTNSITVPGRIAEMNKAK